ncbi:MAG: Stp1/IreP family PP2C-type Ser/Thr phosphatase [Actinomycetota bacterium]
MKIKVGVRTDVGRVRGGNEDSYLLSEPLFGIADGMGGHAAGEVASSTAVEALEKGAAQVNPESLVALIKEANRAIFDKATKDDSLHGMGTTCTVVLIEGGNAHLAHVGDSRAYLLRGGDLSRLSEDHTLVGRMVREGQLTEEEAAKHPQRSMITRSLGIDSDVRVDLRSFDVRDGDRIMLCSDGLTSMTDEGTIKRVLQQTKSPQAAADELVDLANEAGGDDNITVVVLDLSGAGGAPPPPPRSASPVEKAAGRTTDAPLGPPPSSGPPSSDDPGFGRRVVRKMVVVLVILVVLVGAGYGALRYSLNNSWFVGVNDEDVVTIYQGRPEEVLGISMKEVEEETGITLEDVPEFKRVDLEEGIKTDSLEEARATVDSLEQLVQNSGRSPRQNEEGTN